jgi:hypothetical protein
MNTVPCTGTRAVRNGLMFYVMYRIYPPSCILQEGFSVIISLHSVMFSKVNSTVAAVHSEIRKIPNPEP